MLDRLMARDIPIGAVDAVRAFDDAARLADFGEGRLPAILRIDRGRAHVIAVGDGLGRGCSRHRTSSSSKRDSPRRLPPSARSVAGCHCLQLCQRGWMAATRAAFGFTRSRGEEYVSAQRSRRKREEGGGAAHLLLPPRLRGTRQIFHPYGS